MDLQSKFEDLQNKFEDLQNKIKEVVRLASCPVCFERMPPAVVCCVNGHAMCSKCKKTLTQCPTCRNTFSAEGHTFVTQLLEALPYPCPNEGCPETYIEKSQMENHEKLFCSYRMTKCKLCSWFGQLKDLKSHIEISSCKIAKGNCDTKAELSLRILDPEYPHQHDTLRHHHEESSITINSEYFKQFFWREQILNITKDKLTFHYTCLPNEKAMNVSFIVNVEFKSDDTKLSAVTKLARNYEDGVLEGVLIFDTEMLKKLKVENKLLDYRFSIKKLEDH